MNHQDTHPKDPYQNERIFLQLIYRFQQNLLLHHQYRMPQRDYSFQYPCEIWEEYTNRIHALSQHHKEQQTQTSGFQGDPDFLSD